MIKEAENSAVSRGTADPVTLRKMEELQNTLMGQMAELKGGMGSGGPGGGGSGDGGVSADGQARISQLESENQKLKRFVSNAKMRKASVSLNAGVSDEALIELKEENAKLKTQLGEALNGTFGESNLLKSLEAAEKKCAQLSTDKAVLEEELSQYKTFMTKEISKYKAQIGKLKRGK